MHRPSRIAQSPMCYSRGPLSLWHLSADLSPIWGTNLSEAVYADPDAPSGRLRPPSHPPRWGPSTSSGALPQSALRAHCSMQHFGHHLLSAVATWVPWDSVSAVGASCVGIAT